MTKRRSKAEQESRNRGDSATRELLLRVAEQIDADEWDGARDTLGTLRRWCFANPSGQGPAWDRDALAVLFRTLETLAGDLIEGTETR